MRSNCHENSKPKLFTRATGSGIPTRRELLSLPPRPSTRPPPIFYEETAKLDRVLGREEPGFCYGRYDNPTRTGLEELLTELESGHSAQVCSSGMMAIHVALLAALTDRRKSVLAANALYGATTTLLTNVLEPHGRVGRFRGHLRSGGGASTRSPNRSPAAS